MLIKEKKINISEFSYFLGLFLYVTYYFYKSTVFDYMIPNRLGVVLRVSAVMLFLIKIFLNDRFIVKEIIMYMLLILLTAIIVVNTQYLIVIDLVIVTLASRNIDFDKIVKYVFFLVLFYTLSTIVLSMFGKIDNIQYVRNGSVRNSFGMKYSTVLGARIFYLTIMYCYIKRDKFRYYDYILLVLLAVWVDIKCDARLAVITILITGIGMGFYYILKNKNLMNHKFISFFMIYSTVISAIIAIVTSFYYSPNNKFFVFLDKILSRRLQLGSEAFSKYDIQLFGQHIQMNGYGGYASQTVGFKYFFIDSSFLVGLLCYGLIFFLIYLLIVTNFLKKCFYNNNLILLMVFTIISISNIVGEDLFNISFNIFTLAICADITDVKVIDKKIYIN